MRFFFFFFNDTATTEIYTLSLHDALPIYHHHEERKPERCEQAHLQPLAQHVAVEGVHRSEEHRSVLQSPCNLVCRLLLEKKKTKYHSRIVTKQPNSQTQALAATFQTCVRA